MHTLTLTREFPIVLTIGRALELKRLGLLDVKQLLTEPEQLRAIISDPVLNARVFWEMTDKLNWTFESFCEMLAATNQQTLWEELNAVVCDFFPVPFRPLICELFASVLAARNDMVKQMLDSLTQNESPNDNVTTNDFGIQSGTGPGSLDSILVPSPIDNSTTWSSENNVPNGHASAA